MYYPTRNVIQLKLNDMRGQRSRVRRCRHSPAVLALDYGLSPIEYCFVYSKIVIYILAYGTTSLHPVSLDQIIIMKNSNGINNR